MSKHLNTIDAIRRMPGQVIDTAMVAALSTADSESLTLLVLSLLNRRSEVGLTGLVLHFDDIGNRAQQMVVSHVDRLDGVLRQMSTRTDLRARVNVLNIVNRSRRPRLAYLLAEQLNCSDEQIIAIAAEGLLLMAKAVFLERGDSETESVSSDELASNEAEHDASFLVSALGEACRSFHKHRQRNVLLALTCLSPQHDERIQSFVSDSDSPGHGMFTDLIMEADHPLMCRAMLSYLRVATLENYVVKALGKSRVGKHLDLIVSLSHLLLVPETWQQMHRIGKVEHLLPDETHRLSLRESQKRAYARWIFALPLEAERKAEAISQLAMNSNELTRVVCLRRLMEMEDVYADRVISTMCFDGHSSIVRIALRHLIRRKWEDMNVLMARMIGSHDVRIQRIAERHLGPSGFARLWENWPHLSPESRIAMGRALVKIDRYFHHEIVAQMESDDPEARLRVISIVRQLDRETYFEEQLLRMAEDNDVRVASSAITVLSSLSDSSAAVSVLERALKHDNDRIRSNAIEALEKMDRLDDVYESLVRIASGDGNRSRGTAIRVLMNMPMSEVMPALLDMLGDDESAHRVSALWVVRELGLLGVVNQVAELAKVDPVGKVRQRAVRVIREMAENYQEVKSHDDDD